MITRKKGFIIFLLIIKHLFVSLMIIFLNKHNLLRYVRRCKAEKSKRISFTWKKIKKPKSLGRKLVCFKSIIIISKSRKGGFALELLYNSVELLMGLEPTTGWLQVSYSTNWVKEAYLLVCPLDIFNYKRGYLFLSIYFLETIPKINEYYIYRGNYPGNPFL